LAAVFEGWATQSPPITRILLATERSSSRWRQYDVVEVSAFAREGHACAPLLNLAHLGWTTAASDTGAGDQPCVDTGGGCGVEKGWLRISLFCSEDCRLRCEMVKFT
jgi:hypothetical protein